MKGTIRHATLIALTSVALPAAAADGVLEISQECALNGGCFAGDSAGFPVTIANAGSYRLTSNLDVDVPAVGDPKNTTAIEITASRVALDLGGFTVQGPTSCSGSPTVTSCSPVSTTLEGQGIDQVVTRTDVTIRNGTVAGMADIGLRVGRGALIRDVEVRENAGIGLQASERGVVVGVRSVRNGIAGLDLGANSLLANSFAVGNSGAGVDAGESVVIRNNTARHNGLEGIKTAFNPVIVDNTVANNGSSLNSDGILLSNNSGDGEGVVVGNSVSNNTGFGLDCGTAGNSSGYGRNTFFDNNTGGPPQVENDCVEIDTNICGTNTSCP